MPAEKNSERFGYKIFPYKNFTQFLSISRRSETGVHSIGYGDGSLDLLVINRNAPTTIICFHAAMSQSTLVLPVFAGLNFTRGLAANLVFVSDPSLERDLGLAWFAGDRERSLQDDLPEILQQILRHFDTAQNVVFFGPSGGGYAALYYASQFPGSLAIPVNPQTSIDRYNQRFVKDYLEKCWGGVPIHAAPFTHDVDNLYNNNPKTHVAYLQNVGDTAHIDDQLLPWISGFADSEADWLGLLLGFWGSGHQPAPTALLRNIFQNAVSSEGDWNLFFRRSMLRTSPTTEEITEARELYLNAVGH